MLPSLYRDERGAALVGYAGMTAITFLLMIGIWSALNGSAGQSLKGTIATVADRYANGFEYGPNTSGPGSSVPPVGGPDSPQAGSGPAAALLPKAVALLPLIGSPSVPDPQRARPGSLAGAGTELVHTYTDPSSGAWGQVEFSTGIYTVVPAHNRAPITVQPARQVQASVDRGTGLITLIDPRRTDLFILNPLTGQAVAIDRATNAYRSLDLQALEQQGIVDISGQPVLPAWLQVVFGIPGLLGSQGA